MAMLTEQEKDQIKTVCDAFPKLSDFDKGLIIGKAEELTRQAKGAGNDRNND